MWSGRCKGALNETSRLILEADGYAPVTANVRFTSSTGCSGNVCNGDPEHSVDIEFPGMSVVHLHDGSSAEIVVHFRKPVGRRLQFVDEKRESEFRESTWMFRYLYLSKIIVAASRANL